MQLGRANFMLSSFILYIFKLLNISILFHSLAATMASIGSAGVPSVAPVAILIVLQAAGLPPEAISLIFSVDWFL